MAYIIIILIANLECSTLFEMPDAVLAIDLQSLSFIRVECLPIKQFGISFRFDISPFAEVLIKDFT
jgi:hypothetical protein